MAGCQQYTIRRYTTVPVLVAHFMALPAVSYLGHLFQVVNHFIILCSLDTELSQRRGIPVGVSFGVLEVKKRQRP